MTALTGWVAPHETSELWPFQVTANDVPILIGVEACVLLDGTRPTEQDWEPAVSRDGGTHVRVSGLDKGRYYIWVRVTRGDEHPVLRLDPPLRLD